MSILKKALSIVKIIMFRNNKPKLFIRYIFFAGIAALVDLSLLYMLTSFFAVHYFMSAFFAYIFGMITNYSLNKIFNFQNKSKRYFKQFFIFVFVASIGLFINQLIIFSLVEFLEMYYMLAKIISIAIVMFWSFFGHYKFTFKK